MGTRGAIGFHRNGKDRITYNHFDSYPEYLGDRVLKFIEAVSIEEMNKIFDELVLVKDSYNGGIHAGVDLSSGTQPTDDQVQEVKDFFARYTGNGNGWKDTTEEIFGVKMATDNERDWYWLLRMAQSDLFAYRHGLRYMVDSAEFMQESLFCEYAYILNLDKGALEFYTGFNHEPQTSEENRYETNDPYICLGGAHANYYAVRLKAEFTFNGIKDMGTDYVLEQMKGLVEVEGE